MVYEDRVKNLETLPWQVLFDVAIAKKIDESDVKRKDKHSIITRLLAEDTLDDSEIEILVNNYIYGDRVTFTLWTLDSNIIDEDYEKVLQLEGRFDPFLDTTGFRNLKILSVKEHPRRFELLYVYSKEYSYTNESGHADSVWELHRGCIWIGKQANYLASISKHDKMTQLMITFISGVLGNPIRQIKPPKAAIERCIKYKAVSRVVLQSANGEKTIISKSDGFTEAQQEEADRLRVGRYDTSGSYIAEISDNTSATVKYNVNKGNIGIYKHLAASELFEWSENAITIILEEIDKLRGKSADEIFRELGIELKWSISPKSDCHHLNWLLTQVIASANDEDERVVSIPSDFKTLLSDNTLFIKVPRIYCHDCESYEIPICRNCGNPISIDKLGNPSCDCGAPLSVTCGERHTHVKLGYWYIPTSKLTRAIEKNVHKIYKDTAVGSFCIMDNEFHLIHGEQDTSVEISFQDVVCFQQNSGFDDRIRAYAIRMNEKCGNKCTYEKISKCISDGSMSCLPKVFYSIIPGYRPQPHMNGEYGDVAGQVLVGTHSYELKGIIKRNTKNISYGTRKSDKELIEEPLKSTSKEGQEIIRQFVEQGLADTRTSIVAVIAPQYFDANLKGTLRFLARIGNKKILFIGLDEICILLAANNTIAIK